MVNALNFAFFTIFNREFVHQKNYSPQLVSTWVFCGAALWSLPLLAIGNVQPPSGPPNEFMLLITMALVSTFATYSLLNLGLKRVSAGEAAVVRCLPLSLRQYSVTSSSGRESGFSQGQAPR